MSISDIVNVVITRETQAVSQVGFGTMMVLGVHKKFPERIRFYQTLDGLVLDGFDENDPEYKCVASAFAQNPRPVQVAVGRRSVDTIEISVPGPVSEGDVFTVTLNGFDFSFEALLGSTNLDVAEELSSLIDSSIDFSSVDNEDGSFSVTMGNVNQYYSASVSSNLQLAPFVASASMAADLTAINEENSNFYGVVLTSREVSDVLAAANWVESQLKILGAASNDTEILNPSSESDLGFLMKQNGYSRSFLIYHDQANNFFPEAALIGQMLAYPAGSATWAFKNLAGIPFVKLNSNQRLVAFSKNVNTYEQRGGANIIKDAKMSSGEYIDIIVGVDWLQSRIVERIYGRLNNLQKISYTDAGIAIIVAEVRAQLDQGIAQEVIAEDPPYAVTFPRARDVPVADRANRFLPDIKFTARLAGAIHSVEVRGVVSI